jgi:thimet oligopeptidase
MFLRGECVKRSNINFLITNLFIIIFILTGCNYMRKSKNITREDYCRILTSGLRDLDDTLSLLSCTKENVTSCIDFAIDFISKELKRLLDIQDDKRTFSNTFGALDKIKRAGFISSRVCVVLGKVAPDEGMLRHINKEHVRINNFIVETLANQKLYFACKYCAQNSCIKESLTSQERYFISQTLKEFERNGLLLSSDKLEKVKALKKRCTELVLEFEKNIASDKNFISVTRDSLAGLDNKFIDLLARTPDGKYKLGCDYPTYFEVMENCSCAKTRKDLYVIFNTRAYPENKKVLDDLIETRDTLAKELGFGGFAALSYDSKMVKTVDRVENFLNDLWEKSKNKISKELEIFTKDLPPDVSLDSRGRLAPWDISYVKECYKKKNFSLDEREVAKYFPVEQTLNKIFEVYQKFLGLKFTLIKPENSWHKDVKCIEIKDDKNKCPRGFVFLDLYPRDNKYSHACEEELVPPTLIKEGVTPAVAVIIANFPKSNGDTPALFKFNDVKTFFHEFGHVMHFVLSATKITSQSAGPAVKLDFVEVPSQMFEEWVLQPEVINIISGHYKTGEKLPKKLIDNIIALKKYDAGMFLHRQCWLASLAYKFFSSGQKKDTDKIVRDLALDYLDFTYYPPEAHFEMSFGHLGEYDACYYSYMWSLVYALDLFYKIKSEGLLDSKVGARLIETVLGKGSSDEPENLLKNFLGRPPTMDAFIDHFGLNE